MRIEVNNVMVLHVQCTWYVYEVFSCAIDTYIKTQNHNFCMATVHTRHCLNTVKSECFNTTTS